MKKTILIAEDTDDNFMFLYMLLRHEYHILRAYHGKEAVQMVDTHPIDLIFMDIKMPLMDGIEASRLIHATHPNIPIIAVTALTTPEHAEAAIEAGCCKVLLKPVMADAYMSELERLLGPTDDTSALA